MADGKYCRLNPKCKIAMYAISGPVALILAAFAVAMFFVDGGSAIRDYYGIALAAIAGLIAAYFIVRPLIFYRYYGYIVNSDRVDVRYGVFFRHRIIVPIERIHQVEVKRGPVLSPLGLAKVQITTAGGSANIDYLEISVANSIAEELNNTINKIIRDRE